MAERSAGGDPTSGGLERSLWLAIYVVLVLAPMALMYVADKPGDRSAGVIIAAGVGFAALVMLSLQFVMPTRARAFTAPFGIDVLLSFHRQIGIAALALVIVHVVVLVVDDPDRLALLNPLDAPFRAQAGVAAIVALFLLVATSAWRTRFRLRYERWRLVHIALGGLVVAGGFAHVIGVSEYLSAGALRWAVLLSVLAAAGAVFYLRTGRPFVSAGRAYRLTRVRPERGGAVTLALEAQGHDGLAFRPGQFAWLKLGDAPYSLTEHPFSFSSSAARPESPEFTIKAVGDFTEDVRQLERNTRVLLDGPHGSFSPDAAAPSLVFIAGGIGITPVMSILRTLDDERDGRPLTLVYGNRRWEEVTFREELEDLRHRLTLEVVHVLSQPAPDWTGERGRIDRALLGSVLSADAREGEFFVCGPPAMTRAALAALRALGVPAERIHGEAFAAA